MFRRAKIGHALSARNPTETHFQNKDLEKNGFEANYKRSTQSRGLCERALVLLQEIIKNMANKAIKVKACFDCSRKIPTSTENSLTQIVDTSSIPYEELKYTTKFESGGFDDHSIDLYLKERSARSKPDLFGIKFKPKYTNI